MQHVTEGNTTWVEYSDAELEAAWAARSHLNAASRFRGASCVVRECSKAEAIHLSRLFVREVYAEPERCHYDGHTLSMYCGQVRDVTRIMVRAASVTNAHSHHSGLISVT